MMETINNNYKICRYCKQKFTKEDILKEISQEHLADRTFKRKTFCSSKCAYKFRNKPSKKYIHFIENPFPEDIRIHWHHVNDIIVFPVPKKIHRLKIGSQNNHRSFCNDWIKKLFNLNMKYILMEVKDEK